MTVEVGLLDGSTRFLDASADGLPTAGALRHWIAAEHGLPCASLLRLKAGSRDLADAAPLDTLGARVNTLLRLPGGTHPMDAMCRAFPADPQRAILEKNKNRELAEKNRGEAAKQVNELLKKKLENAKFEAFPEPNTAGATARDASYKAQLEKQRRKLMDGGSDSDSSVSVFDPFMSKKAKKELKKHEKKEKKSKKEKKEKKEKREKKEKKEKKSRKHESESESSDSDDEVERKRRKREKKEKKEKRREKREEGGAHKSGGESSGEEEERRKKQKRSDEE